MGCFSFICKKSKKPALSSSFNGTAVHMFLLNKGKVIEHMYGNYDSYGRVFIKDGMKKSPPESMEWKMDWGDVTDLIFNGDPASGIALIRDPFWKEGDPYPAYQSEQDPNQGWGDESEDCESSQYKFIENPYHKIL